MSTDLQSGTTRAAGLSTPQAVLAACAVVVTGHLLGVAWLSETVLGLPAGLWVIGLGACVCSASTRRRIAGAVDAAWCLIEPGVRARPRATDAEPNTRGVGWWPRGSVAASIVDASTRAAGAAVRAALVPLWGAEVAYVGSARARAEEWLARLAWPTRPLRIGLRMPADEAEALASAPGAARVEWFDLTSWDDPQAACRRHLLDAVAYHEGEGPVRIVTLERPGHCAGIIEWADLRGELTIASLFPARVDPAAVVVEGATRTRVRE
ncbi:MAG TPA: hypothetical protein VFF69_12075, partial [Phycisphaerales bacterium]|nr:hypothetical protein [Phycisphaerales bacterium]